MKDTVPVLGIILCSAGCILSGMALQYVIDRHDAFLVHRRLVYECTLVSADGPRSEEQKAIVELACDKYVTKLLNGGYSQ